MKSQIYIANLKELWLIKFDLLMRRINLKLWQIYPLFAKSNLVQNLTAILNLTFLKQNF